VCSSDLFVIAVFNPVTKEQQYTRQHITNLINALYRYGEQVVFFMPNIDPSNEIIREQIHVAAQKSLNKWFVCESIPHEIFLSLMSYAEMMVGNSSSGIFEAPYYLLPVVNIGTRQSGRIKPYNVYDCGYGEEEIMKTMLGLTNARKVFEIKNEHLELEMPFGLQGASQAIARILNKELSPYQPVEVRGSECGTEPHD
jgi:UDP-N-acetylglucosamine 2-epimerase